jgi:serine/threonine-protein phosphatase 6 regulatory ankyrin repeat subunit B
MNVQAPSVFNAALRDFLVSQYDAESLYRLVADMPDGKVSIKPFLTYPNNLFGLSTEIVELSYKEGQLQDLKDALLAQRSEVGDLIEQIWSLPIPSDAVLAVRKQPSLCPAIPQLPEYLEERPEYSAIRAALRSRQALVGITGLPGSGKTTAAIASLDEATRAYFAAVCWLDTDLEMSTQAQAVRERIALQLGGERSKDITREELAGLALDRVGEGYLLIVIDESRTRLDEMVKVARCHPRTSILVTSTESSSLFSIGIRDPIHLADLPRDVGVRVLSRWAGLDAASLPRAAWYLAEAIGFHAEGLRILGATVACASNPSAEWQYLENQLRERALLGLALPGIPEINLAALVDQIAACLSPELLDMVNVLAVPPPGSLVNATLLGTLSGVPPDACRRRADDLVRRSLALTSSSKYGLRAIVHLHTREQHGFDAQYREALARVEPIRPALIWSIALGDERMALRLVGDSSPSALAESTPKMGSALHQAAFHGLSNVVEAILMRGVNPAALDSAGADALHYAAQSGQMAVVAQLLAGGLSPLRPNDGGKSALWIALHHRHYSIAKLMLDTAAVPVRGSDLASDLQKAVKCGVIGVVERLLTLGAPHDPELGPRNTPLLALAVGSNHVEVAGLLLEYGGTTFRSDTLSEALLFAAQNNHVSLLAPLISAGADLEWKKVTHRTPLQMAAIQGHTEIVRQLLLAGSSLSEPDGNGWTAVHLAAAFHQAEVIALLHEAGADLDTKGPGGQRPLGLCVQQARPGATMESSMSLDENGSAFASVVVLTALDPRVIRTVRTLLAKGADVNATDASARSALHYAAHVFQPELVNELLAHGARCNLQDANGKTPLDIAREALKSDRPPLLLLRLNSVVKLLEDRGE